MSSGLEQPNTIDLVTHDPVTDEFALIMIESRPWDLGTAQIDQLVDKINTYVAFALDEGFLTKFPQAAGKPLRLQLDCACPPSDEATAVIDHARKRLEEYGIRFAVNVLG